MALEHAIPLSLLVCSNCRRICSGENVLSAPGSFSHTGQLSEMFQKQFASLGFLPSVNPLINFCFTGTSWISDFGTEFLHFTLCTQNRKEIRLLLFRQLKVLWRALCMLAIAPSKCPAEISCFRVKNTPQAQLYKTSKTVELAEQLFGKMFFWLFTHRKKNNPGKLGRQM